MTWNYETRTTVRIAIAPTPRQIKIESAFRSAKPLLLTANITLSETSVSPDT